MPLEQPSSAVIRLRLLHQLQLTEVIPEFDATATELSAQAGVPWAMINIFDPVSGHQMFLGLAQPADSNHMPMERIMAPKWGYCPEVAHRTKALVLPDVTAKPRYASNPVVDRLGVRTYAGAPLVHDPDHARIVFGTVCFVGNAQMDDSTGDASLKLIKEVRDHVQERIYERAGIRPHT